MKIGAFYERTKYKICEGTDTLSYTASALSFMLENLGKTVIVTGSQVNQVTIHVLAKILSKVKFMQDKVQSFVIIIRSHIYQVMLWPKCFLK